MDAWQLMARLDAGQDELDDALTSEEYSRLSELLTEREPDLRALACSVRDPEVMLWARGWQSRDESLQRRAEEARERVARELDAFRRKQNAGRAYRRN